MRSNLQILLLILAVTTSGAGQTPPGIPEAVRVPTRVAGVDDVVDAAIGDHFFVVARRDGRVVSWGYNNFGQLGNGRVGSTAGSDADKTMGFVVQGTPAAVEGPSDVISVAAGGEHALAVRRDGTVWGWGSNGSGQLALGKTNRGANPRPTLIPGIQHAAAVAARASTSYALLADGTILGWGDRLWRVNGRAVSSETPIPLPTVRDAVAIRAGQPSLALLRSGHVAAWGTGVLGDGNPAQQDYAAPATVQPVVVDGIDDAIAIAAGAGQSGIVRKDGSVWVWGNNGNNGLGLGKVSTGAVAEVRVPARVPGIANAVDLAIASGSSVVSSDGSLRTWGDARLGATARSGIERVMAPTVVPGVNSLVRVWGSAYSNLGLTRDGHLLAWGSVFLAP